MKKEIRITIVLVGMIAAIALAGCASNAAGPALDGASPAINDAAQSGPQAAGNDPAGVIKGSVAAPGCEGFSFTQPDKYSVCGFAVLNAVSLADKVKIFVRLAEGAEVPGNAGKVLVQTIKIEWYMDGKLEAGPNEKLADVDICYSASPGKVLVVEYYDGTQKAWAELDSVVDNDQVCAKMTMTGLYVLAEKE